MKLNREALVVIRERSGLSKTELAERAGIDRTLVHRLENGERNASVTVIRKLAVALQCSVLAISTCDQPTDTEAAA